MTKTTIPKEILCFGELVKLRVSHKWLEARGSHNGMRIRLWEHADRSGFGASYNGSVGHDSTPQKAMGRACSAELRWARKVVKDAYQASKFLNKLGSKR